VVLINLYPHWVWLLKNWLRSVKLRIKRKEQKSIFHTDNQNSLEFYKTPWEVTPKP